MTTKIGNVKSSAQVWKHQKRICLSLTPGRSKGTNRVWKLIGSETWRNEHSSGQCEDSQKVGTRMHSDEDRSHKEPRGRIRRWNVVENSKSVSALSLSSWHVVSLCPSNAVDSAFVLCFFSRQLLKSEVANKALY